MRKFWAVLPFAILAACGTEVAPRDEGVGFGDYESYLAEQARQREERRRQIATGMVVSPESTLNAEVEFQAPKPVAPKPEQIVRAAPRSETPLKPIEKPKPVIDTLAQEEAESDLPTTSDIAAVDPDNPDISDEQNFDAVSARETIESDRERLRQQREQFKVIEPTALPKRRGSSGPNIVAYAISTNHAIGEVRHQRGPFKNAATTARNCAKYLSSDLAQEAFLASGGPARDPKRLDPDGDGFACSWDPTPFRLNSN